MSTSNEKQPATDPQKIKLINVRLSYPVLFVPKTQEGDEGKEPKYSASFLLDKKQHAALIKHVDEMTQRIALNEFKKKVPLKHVPLRDGNEKSDRDGYGDDVMFISARSTKRPVVVDADKSPLTAEDGKPYAGCYVNAVVRLFAYSHPTGGKGVGVALQAVQFAKDGEPFGAAPVDADAEFDDVSGNDGL